MTEPLLQADHLLKAECLECERDGRFLFRDLSFSIVPGTLTRVEGPNGSGKTTLLRILAGLNDNWSGQVLWRGRPRHRQWESVRRNLLYLGHRPGIKALLTPLENLQALAAGRQAVTNRILEQALAQVGLGPWCHVPCQNLSAGQKRRVALARLLFADEPLWLLDEAFTALDVDAVAAVENLLLDQVRRGGAVVMTTHHEPSLRNMNRIRLGTVIEQGEPSSQLQQEDA
ncbi:heme exporter protein A [Marinobacter daqiaonensis]|uniref:Heme exporter protein A n=1 Tax=Marinobacter daqiaonensis TaxID=650891 RepID=A0A1I6H5I8_9GAMM|nr:cytochrome c biogenesis heme-transporting ATPase CcmA [Marinobacter daqiaonensis]SFR49796.1 heme exporter protein A [Marinobacter daqiaonensis]